LTDAIPLAEGKREKELPHLGCTGMVRGPTVRFEEVRVLHRYHTTRKGNDINKFQRRRNTNVNETHADISEGTISEPF
jgi:hypothetical protein